MPRVVHFDIYADNPKKAIEFYEKVFGWEFTKWEGPRDYWLIKTGKEDEPGIDGGLGRREDPNAAVTDTIDVPSVDKFIEKIEENNGTIVAPKMSIPGVGYLAYFMDPEGNVFGIMESDESAK